MQTTRIARTIKVLAVTLAVSAFAAPAADVKPLEPPVGSPSQTVHHASAVAHGSTGGIGWADAAIAVVTIVVLIGLAALGARTANRSTVEA